MNERHREQHALLASLGAPSRFRIALCLLEGDRCVGDLAIAIGLSQSCTTRHVQALERHGVVRSRRDGKRVLVALELARPGLAEMLGLAAGPGMVNPPASPSASPPVAARRARVPRSPSARGAQRPSPSRAEPKAEDLPPAGDSTSGTHPSPVADPPVYPRRPPETLEDFLL